MADDLLQRVCVRVQDSMDEILTNFSGEAKITVLVRTPGKPTADFCMTSDDLDKVLAMVHRRKGDAVPPAPLMVPDLTNEQKEITLLRVIEAMGGTTDSSEHAYSWLNWFCSDECRNVQEDTFNRCEAKGWLWTTHNSDYDTSTTTLTEAGRAALAATEGSNNVR